MTEPKKEKCEACCGSGYINFWTDDGHISMRTCRRCDGYGYIKVVPMTNEEYLKSCNTEQLAELITDIVWECKEQDDCMDCKLDWCSKGHVAEWLKQPHTPKE